MYEWIKVCYVPFNTVLGYIRKATSEGMKLRMIVRQTVADFEPTLASDLRFVASDANY